MEKSEQHSSSQNELLKSHNKRRRSRQKFDELKIQIGVFPGSIQEAKMQDNILAINDQNSNFRPNVHPSEKTENVRPSEKMKKNSGIKDQRRMTLVVENSTKEKTEVSQVPQDKTLQSVSKDDHKNEGLPSQTEVLMTRHSKISKPECHGNK